jgi:hypothetical protein
MEAFDGDDYSSENESEGEEGAVEIHEDDSETSEEESDVDEPREADQDHSKLSNEQLELIQFKAKLDKASESGFAALQQLQQQLGTKMSVIAKPCSLL